MGQKVAARPRKRHVVCLTPGFHRAVKTAASRKGLSISGLVEQAVIAYAKKHCPDLIAELDRQVVRTA